MSKSIDYKFTINEFTPETLPTTRLAEYLADLAVNLEQENN